MATSFQQRVNFKAQPEQVVEEFNFDGGLVLDKHETKLKPNQSPDLSNVIFNDTGSIKTRNGSLRYNTDPVGATSDEANTGASTGTLTIDAPGEWVAQTFQVGAQADMVQVDFYLEMDTSGEEQYMQCELWSGSTGPSALISTGQILLVSGAAETEYSFRFRVPYTLAATTEYAAVLKPYVRGSVQTVNAVLVHRTGTAYGSGAAYSSTDSGLTWASAGAIDLKFNVYTGGSTGCTGLIRFYTDSGLQQTLSKYGTTLYRGNDNTGAMTAITFPSGVSLTSANFLDWTIANNTLLVVDDSNYIKKYRGSTNADYTTGTITVTNADATITGSGTTWSTTTNAEVGEYIKLPDSKWYKIASIASNTSLEIETAYQGSTLAGQSYIISPWGEVQGRLSSSDAVGNLVRPQPTYIENHFNRIWTLDGNELRFSCLDLSSALSGSEHFNDWDTANNAGAIIIPSGKGDSGTGLYSLNNSLYVFQRRAIWRVYGNSPGNFELRNITNEIGMISKKTLVEWNDILVFLSDKGIVFFDGSHVRNVSDGVINTFIDTWSNKTSPSAILWGNKYLISYTPSGGSGNSEALFLDLTRGIFGKIEGVYANIWNTWNGGTDTGQVYFGSSNQGTQYKWDTGGHDDGYEIYSQYDTPSLSFGAGINDKAIKKFYIQQIALGDWEMNVTQLADIGDTEISGTAINLSSGDDVLWGVAQWGVDEWPSEASLKTDRIAEFQGLAKYFKFRIEQEGYDEGIEVLGLVATSKVRRLT